jgi:hypothetical protein
MRIRGALALVLLLTACHSKKAPPRRSAAEVMAKLKAAPEAPLGALVPEGMSVVLSSGDLGGLIQQINADPQFAKLLHTPLGEDLALSAWTRLPFAAAARVRSYTASPLSPVSYEEALRGPGLLAIAPAPPGSPDDERYLFIKALDLKVDAAMRVALAWREVSAREHEIERHTVEGHEVTTLHLGSRHLSYAVLRNRFLAATDEQLLANALGRLKETKSHYALDERAPLATTLDLGKLIDWHELKPLSDGLTRVSLQLPSGLGELKLELEYADSQRPPPLSKELLRAAPRTAIAWWASSRALPAEALVGLADQIADHQLAVAVRRLAEQLTGAGAYSLSGIDRSAKYPTLMQVVALSVRDERQAEARAVEVGARLFAAKPQIVELPAIGQKLSCFAARAQYHPCLAVARGQLMVSGHQQSLADALAALVGKVPSLADRPESHKLIDSGGQAAALLDPAALAAFLQSDVERAHPKPYTGDDIAAALGSTLVELRGFRTSGVVLTRSGTRATGTLGAL